MALSRSSRRALRALTVAGTAAVAFAGVLLISKPAHAQRYYTYYSRPAPPPPSYGYSYGPAYGPAPRPYYQDPYVFQLGLDLEGVAPLNPPNGVNGQAAIGGGAGFKIRAGEQLRFPTGVRFTPEVLYAYDHLWAQDNLGSGYDWSMNRVVAGARLGFGRFIVPTVYAHIGYGWRQTDATYVTGQNGGLGYDFGAALDFHVAPHFSLGAHIEYAQIALSTDTPQWLAAGGHVDFLF